MGFLKLFLFGIILSLGAYYLHVYLKGAVCHISSRVDGKHVLITGANTGLGFETALELASRGGIIHMACRNDFKCEEAKNRILKLLKINGNAIITHTLDLASVRSILEFTQAFKQKVPKLDILINNAAVFMCPYRESYDGFEMQIGVNHLGHFLLTNELLNLIKLGDSPRIIIISSAAHEIGSIDSEDINLRGEKYGRIAAYAESKLANVLHAKALSRRLRSNGVAVVSLHPGVVNTELQREWPQWAQKVFQLLEFMLFKSAKEGAQTQICCAVDSDLIQYTGEYFSDCRPISSRNSQVYNETLSEWLWQHSEQLINSKVLDL